MIIRRIDLFVYVNAQISANKWLYQTEYEGSCILYEKQDYFKYWMLCPPFSNICIFQLLRNMLKL